MQVADGERISARGGKEWNSAICNRNEEEKQLQMPRHLFSFNDKSQWLISLYDDECTMGIRENGKSLWVMSSKVMWLWKTEKKTPSKLNSSCWETEILQVMTQLYIIPTKNKTSP